MTVRRHVRRKTAMGSPTPTVQAAYHGRVALAVHMWERLDDAAGELRGVPPAELFARFLSWAR